jgi:hypothetical protein
MRELLKFGLAPASGRVMGSPPSISPCGNILTVHGFRVDSVFALCLDSWEELIEEPISTAFQIWMEVIFATSGPLSVTPKEQQSALMRTLIAGNEFAEMERAFEELCDFVDDPDQGKIPLGRLFPELTDAGVRFVEGMSLTFKDRILFKSGRGAVGLVPKGAQFTDEIWIIFGCPTPIVLRQEEDEKYSVVGVTYVDGIMKGEAVNGMPDQVENCRYGEFEVVTVAIR